MKYVKMSALAAVAAGALMAFIGAGTASATVLCSTTVDPCPAGQDLTAGSIIDFSIPPGQSSLVTNTAGEPLDECTESTVKGELTTTGGATSTPTGDVSTLSWGHCTFITETLVNAGLEIHKIAGTSNGTVTADGQFEWTTLTPFGTCVYGVTSGESIGDLTEGNPVILHVNAIIDKFSGNILCSSTARWQTTYTMTEPANTTISVGNG